MFQQLVTTVGDILAPPRCLGCLKEMTWLCSACRLKAFAGALSCIACEKNNPTGRTCAECLSKTRLSGVISVGLYQNTLLQRGIHWLKFKNIQALAPLLAELLVLRLPLISPLAQLQKTAVLVPIPLHTRRYRQRGFNQSTLIAQHISKYTRIPYHDILNRTKATLPQTKLPTPLRHTNTLNAFSLTSLPSSKVIILLDDVTTTGSTLHSAALTFPKNYTIWGCTVARG